MDIKVCIDEQHLYIRDFYSIYLPNNIEEIKIIPIFLRGWDNLDKKISFSSDCYNYTEYDFNDEGILVPSSFLRAPGVAIVFKGNHSENQEIVYEKKTNFIVINIRGVDDV